jgi:hypothetical protein
MVAGSARATWKSSRAITETDRRRLHASKIPAPGLLAAAGNDSRNRSNAG